MSTTRERILAAAEAAHRQGRTPSVREITAAAGVSRATFYRTFRSTTDLESAMAVEPGPQAGERVLMAAADLLARDGLARLSMDELAAAAGVSRAALYRLYPGKGSLFAAMVRRFSPVELVVETLSHAGDAPPEEVMPRLAVAVWRTVSSNLGVVRPLLFEASALGPDVRETVLAIFPTLLGAMGGYLLGQMAAGRLRAIHPLLAMQSFAGPIIVHVLLRPVVAGGLGLDLDSQAAVEEFAGIWVRGMRPDGPS